MTKYTKDDIGFIPFIDSGESEQKYYEGLIEWAFTTHGFTPDYDHPDYPRFMWEQPFLEFPKSKNEHLYADFIDTVNFMNNELCDESVGFDFQDGIIKLISRWE